jgi:hypothetical protein
MKALAALAAVSFLAGCGGSAAASDSSVANSLQTLLNNHNVTALVTGCVHQNGDQYACQVTGAIDAPQGTMTLQVADDGHGISEQGIGPQPTSATSTQPADGTACTTAGGDSGILITQGANGPAPGVQDCVSDGP